MAGQQSGPRSRKWTVQMSYYYATHDANGNVKSNMTVDDWKAQKKEEFKNMVQSGKCKTIVWIFHENDIDKDGQPKGIHVHVIVFLVNPATQSAMMSLFGVTREQDCEYVKKNAGAFRYLLHITDKAINDGKYIYAYENIEVATTDKKFELRKEFIEHKKDKDDDVDKIIETLHKNVMTGKYVLSDVRKVYLNNASLGATAWRKDKRKYDDDMMEYMSLVNEWYTVHNCCKCTIMISGGGGTQKTDLAQRVIAPAFMDKRGVHVPSAPMGRVTYDPIGTYEGQLVSVLNEIKGSSWILEGFCECLDPTHAGLTGARYHDRPFFPNVVCLTTSDSVDNFIAEMFCKWKSKSSGEAYEVVKYWNSIHTDIICKLESIRKDTFGMPLSSIDAPCRSDVVSSDSEWDKVWQVRRRIPIIISLADGKAKIEVLDYAKRNCALFESGAYIHYATVDYSVDNESIKTNFLNTLFNAINWYYYHNGFSITPQNCGRPEIEL